MTSVYRLGSSRYASTSGKGAALNGGRWNPIGVEVIYTSATASLAALEVLVQFSTVPRDFVLTEILIPAGLDIPSVQDNDLPTDWDALSPVLGTQEFGRRWVLELRSAALWVPSSIIRMERNCIINPLHADFARLDFSSPTSFRFDPRLK